MFTQNSKLKKDGILGFGLPPVVTCPGAGACKAFCYACKGNFKRFPRIAESLQRNLELTKQPTFVADVVRFLSKKKKARLVRWHPSGDVYNQEYLDKLTKIAELLPNVRFYLYTKSLHLDWSQFDKLQNTSRIQSMVGLHDDKAQAWVPVAVVVHSEPLVLGKDQANGSDSDLVAAYALDRGIQTIFLVKH